MLRCLFHIVPTRSVFDSAGWEEVVRRMEFYSNDSSLEESRVWKSFLCFSLFGEWDVFGCFVRNQTVCTLRNNQQKKGSISCLSKRCLSWRRKYGENMGESFVLSSPHWSMPLDAPIKQLFAPYHPIRRHGHWFRCKKLSCGVVKLLFEASVKKARNGPSTHTQLIEATSCIKRSSATIKTEEYS
jgi:hypothetical protein